MLFIRILSQSWQRRALSCSLAAIVPASLDGLMTAATAMLSIIGTSPATAVPPTLLHTPGYESPVQGGPGDLLLLPGIGFHASDRVVYKSMTASEAKHPAAIPALDDASSGTAPIVKLGSPPYALTVQLPDVMQANRPYWFWVVNAAGEWSEPVAINDPRPLWVTPPYVYSTSDVAGLGRRIRVVGRNLGAQAPVGVDSDNADRIRLQGRNTYVVTAASAAETSILQNYVREASLPTELLPGSYTLSVSLGGRSWIPVPGQTFEVRAEKQATPRFDISDAAFGACQPNDAEDDTPCFVRALEAAQRAGAGTVFIPAGKWDLTTAHLPGDQQRNGFIVPRNVSIVGTAAGLRVGASSSGTQLIRHDSRSSPQPGALITLTGGNSVLDISFTDADRYDSLNDSRAVIQLGIPLSAAESQSAEPIDSVNDIVISADTFMRVGRALLSSGRPILRLFVTRIEFGGYDNGMLLTGSGSSTRHPFRIDDSVFRDNRFVPGSYLDITARQGTVASQIGASFRVDFSSNTADGVARDALQDSQDPPGWRAAFFWNLTNNGERLLIAENQVTCPGDKAGDGEAIALDGNGNTFGFNEAPTVSGAGRDWVSVRGTLLNQHDGHPLPEAYYNDDWISIAAGSGLGQSRKVVSYSEDRAAGTVRFRVAPEWDVTPQVTGTPGRVILGRQYWQAYIVANQVNQASPPCRKANLNNPRGGALGFWTPVADSVIDGNRQTDTDGIGFLQAYSAHTPSCPDCASSASFVSALEIRRNRIEGEYDWASDCSWSGIRGYFVASRTPESPPPVLGFGIVIANNDISGADGQRGGAIDIARAGPTGPPPGDWPMVQNLLIFRNGISDVNGPPPGNQCRQDQHERTGIRLEGPGNVRDAVLQGNRCEHVVKFLEDSGVATTRVCAVNDAESCECTGR